MSAAIIVDVWSDVICPWCYIGKRRFERGLELYREQGGTLDVQVTYHSFLLAPDTPVDFDGSVADFLAVHKGMPPEHVDRMLEQVTGIAAAEGLAYRFDTAQHTTTLTAHELLHHAAAHGLQNAMVERLFRAYFEEGRHVGRVEDLVELAAEVGLDPGETRAALTDGRHADAVEQDFAQARAYGISGVPFTVVDGRYGVSGAQEAEVFARALAQAAADHQAVPVGGSGA
ncbi:DSBA oxidoreductase [Actinotalea ferrariae CF5-4]|uniref:DSBA oxidoreductase n=1 Tax=Actinotalea ferrariae CF5-4 TaxID=948458 RepID=A0A021VV76_9CELL|nr:DsbA family oxidoreductase [Actinotalea ferrariae]EYR65066.1 DSBA oxidoreductase [Actinotalea ferrariae CF5-4]